MDKNQKLFLAITLGIVILVLMSFLLARRGPRPPVKLELGGSNPPPDPSKSKRPERVLPRGGSDAGQVARQTGRSSVGSGSRYSAKIFEEEDTAPGHKVGAEKSLNVLFNWNGHTWDAYEVLGVPAGSSKASVTAAFEKAKAGSDPDSIAFLQAAHDAIMRA